MCQANGTWSTANCVEKDCGTIPAIINGKYTLWNTSKTTYGSLAHVTCDTGYESNVTLIMCRANASWENAICNPKGCGSTPTILNGAYTLLNTANTTYESLANVTCEAGYESNTSQIMCQANATWEHAKCIPKDCGPLSKPDNGDVVLNASTKYEAVANYSCKDGFQPVGDISRICQNTSTWSGVQPICAKKVCTANTDSRGMDWGNILAGEMRVKSCEAGFTGYVTRKCLEDGDWQLPNYNCTRTAVTNVLIAVKSLQANATTSDVLDALTQISNVTNQEQKPNASSLLTNAEIASISSSLETVANLVEEKGLVTPDIAKNFFKSASNLLDDQNKGSWQSMQESKSNGGEKVLSAVDKLGEALRNKLQNGTDGFNTSITIIETNVAMEVKRVKRQDVQFPTTNITTESSKDDWFKDSQSSIRLDAEALGNTDVVVTAIMYKDMSDILPPSSEDITGSTSGTVLNGPVLSFSIFPKIENLDPPVTLVFKHLQTNLSSASCSYWKFGRPEQPGYWDNDGCKVQTSNDTITVCKCDHLTNFAVLMSPFVEADEQSSEIRLVSIVGISVSSFCLLLTIIVFAKLWRYVRSDRSILLLNLISALLISYGIFIGGIDRTDNKIVCTVVAAALHYIYCAVFCLMLAEGIGILREVSLVFSQNSPLRQLLVFAWGVPVIIVGSTLSITKTNGYGNDHYCWLSLARGLRWAFVGPALFVILFNVIVLILLFKKMFALKAMGEKPIKDKIKTTLWALCVLVPLMGISWSLGIFYINESASFMQYVFAVCNGLQGVYIFVCNCVLNKKVKDGFERERLRRLNKSMTSSFSLNLHNVSKESTSERRNCDKDNTESDPSVS
ncbi:hypothetical protein DPMN_052388 [Dreissena polymorpha]|uniref:Uncharacterized protein n=2 Tax=Dreissena polymorpha TaxID=45954 RepID=A0A9D4HPS3_DREPO|nr:hypothetical protein DPMN_052388 [Dreissena polymorpha]